jgi:hypothetical protein
MGISQMMVTPSCLRRGNPSMTPWKSPQAESARGKIS